MSKRIRRHVYFAPGVTQIIDFADTSYERAFLRMLDEYCESKGISFSSLVKMKLHEWADKENVISTIQASIEQYADSNLATKLEALRTQFEYPNSDKHPDWRTCLRANQLLTQEAIQYSQKRGWNVL